VTGPRQGPPPLVGAGLAADGILAHSGGPDSAGISPPGISAPGRDALETPPAPSDAAPSDAAPSDAEDLACALPDADPDLPEVPDPETETDDCGRPAGRARKVARVVVPLLIGAAAIAVVAGAAGDAGAMVRALRGVRPGVIGLALVCEVASFGFLGLHLRALGGPGANVRRLAPFRIATIVFGLGSIMPAAPAEGLVMAGSALKHRRLARRRTVLVLGVSQFFGTTGLYGLAALDALVVVISAHDGPIAARWLLLVGGIGTLLVLAALAVVLTRRRFAELAGLIAGRLRHLRHPAPAPERRERGVVWHDAAMHVLTEHHKAPWLLITILLGWAFDGGCLYFALRAIGVHVGLDVLLLGYSVSAAASFIPFIPAGLGVVETLTPALLHLYGVPLETALAGLLVYRALGTFLPALVGVGALASLRFQKAPEELPEEAAERAAA